MSALVDTGYMCFDVYGKQDDPSSQRWYCLKNSTDYPKFVAKDQELSKKDNGLFKKEQEVFLKDNELF